MSDALRHELATVAACCLEESAALQLRMLAAVAEAPIGGGRR